MDLGNGRDAPGDVEVDPTQELGIVGTRGRPGLVGVEDGLNPLVDLLGGHFDYMCDQIPHLVQHVRAGSLKAYALAMPGRSPALPDVPTTTELGMPLFQASGWNALFAPKGTPPEIIQMLNAAANKALDDPAIRARYAEMGALIPAPGPRTSAGLRLFIAAEIARWTPIIRASAQRGK